MSETIRPGQRWVSVSEPELGLGEVRGVGPRTITLGFAATGETRQYVRTNPPLRRAAFRVGDVIALRDRQELVVEAVRDEDGLRYYRAAGREVCETALSHTLSFSNPLTRLYAGHFDGADLFDLRHAALLHQHRARQSPVRGFVGGRIDLLPHQLGIAAEVAGRMRPRVLLADEVGLGKTIEAGLILHRLLLTGRVSRVLILVPPSLVHQWFVELLRRFNLWFSIFDEERCGAILEAQPGTNPFLDSQLVLADLGLLTRSPEWRQLALEATWDALVVDEAHHLGWTPEAASPEYEAVDALGRKTPSVLLLTATPEQLGMASHFARLRLLDPDRFHNLEEFAHESAGYREIARIAERLRDRTPLTADDRARVTRLLNQPAAVADATLARMADGDMTATTAVIEALLDQHGTGRVMFRNTRAVVGGFPQRLPLLYPLTIDPSGQDVTRALAREWQADSTGQRETRQPNLRPDPRIEWLAGLLRTLPATEKVLLLCHTQQKALAVEAALKERSAALKMAAFHEGLTLVQRDRGAAWFAEPDGARLLICSEIGSEGRNFQFAHHLVLFDLPLDPALLEQRLGRLDRIGQTQPIRIHVPYVVHSHLEVLARWYHEGLNAFAEHLPGSRELLEQFDARLRELAGHIHDRRFASDAALAALVTDTQTARQVVAARMEAGRDRLLEWNSFRPAAATRLIGTIREQDGDRSLDEFILRVLDLFVVEVEELAPRTYRLGSAGVLVDEFPGLPADGLTLTADRERALVRDDVQFMTWDHPLVTGALDLLLGSEKGNCGFLRWPDDRVQAIYLEAIYMLECVAPARLHVDRFLPPTPLRVLVDHRGQLTPVGALPDSPPAQAGAAQASQARGLLTRTQVRDLLLPKMIEAAKKLADDQVGPLIARARVMMRSQLSSETTRLRSLQKVNRSVRDDEIAGLVQQQADLDKHLSAARLRLDALRLVHRGPAR